MKWTFALAAACSLLSACKGDPDGSANELPPDWPDEIQDAGPEPERDQFMLTGDGGEGDGGINPFPAAWRFECIHIHKLGEFLPNGAAPYQAAVLNRLWQTDIKDHKLNILIGIEGLDANRKAEVYIGSGIGPDDANQCREPTTDGTRFTADIALGSATHVANREDTTATCMAEAPPGTPAYGTVDVQVPIDDQIYIYAQNSKQIPFNCTPEPELPNAVPLRYVSARVSITEDTGEIAGELTACLTKADISKLCSCIGDCYTAMSVDDLQTEGECAGCPKSATPLAGQLAGLITSPACEQHTGGAEAYELTASFFAHRLPSSPDVCGQ